LRWSNRKVAPPGFSRACVCFGLCRSRLRLRFGRRWWRWWRGSLRYFRAICLLRTIPLQSLLSTIHIYRCHIVRSYSPFRADSRNPHTTRSPLPCCFCSHTLSCHVLLLWSRSTGSTGLLCAPSTAAGVLTQAAQGRQELPHLGWPLGHICAPYVEGCARTAVRLSARTVCGHQQARVAAGSAQKPRPRWTAE
jgi:hypothetical protein